MHRSCLSFDCLQVADISDPTKPSPWKEVKRINPVGLLMPTVSPRSGDSLVQASCIDRTDLPRLLDGKRPLRTQAESKLIV